MCRTGLLHSKFWALLNKSPWQRAALQPRGGHLHQHHSVWTGQPGAAGQGPVQNGESHIYSVMLSRWWQSYFSFYIYCLPCIFVRLKRRPVEIAWWGIWPSFDCRFLYLFDFVLWHFLKGCFPKPADLLVIFLTTVISSSFWLAAGRTTFSQDCAVCVWKS